jgi:hypothetical protein
MIGPKNGRFFEHRGRWLIGDITCPIFMEAPEWGAVNSVQFMRQPYPNEFTLEIFIFFPLDLLGHWSY